MEELVGAIVAILVVSAVVALAFTAALMGSLIVGAALITAWIAHTILGLVVNGRPTVALDIACAAVLSLIGIPLIFLLVSPQSWVGLYLIATAGMFVRYAVQNNLIART